LNNYRNNPLKDIGNDNMFINNNDFLENTKINTLGILNKTINFGNHMIKNKINSIYKLKNFENNEKIFFSKIEKLNQLYSFFIYHQR